MAAEEGLQPGWLLAGFVTASPRVIKAAVFWAVGLARGKQRCKYTIFYKLIMPQLGIKGISHHPVELLETDLST